MLNMLRKRAQSSVIQILVLVIAVVFIFWGVGTNLSNNRNSVATVNDAEIPINAFQKSYENAVDNFSRQFGGSIPKGLLDSINMKRQVLNQLIQGELLRQGGTQMGLTASSLAAQEKIKTIPVFQENGTFDMKRYKEILSQNRTNPSAFESDIKNEILTTRVSDAIDEFAMVPSNAVKTLIDYGEEQLKLNYVIFDSKDFQDKIAIEEQPLADWYQGVQDKYKSDPTVRIKYLMFRFADDADQVQLEESVVRARYEAEKDLYETAEKRHARHILFKIPDAKDEAVKQKVREKALKVLESARQGKDFAELAGEHSEGPTKTKGGDLGFFGRGQMVKSFDDAVFSMKEGEISDLVESPFGYHIIKLESIKPKISRSFESVQPEIEKRLKEEMAVGHTMKRASTAYEDIMKAGSIAKYETENKETVHLSDYFPRTSPPESISTDMQLGQSLLKLNKGELSSMIKLDNGYTIVFIDDVKEAEIPKLEDIRQRVVEDYKKEKGVELAHKRAEEFLKEATEKNSLSQAAEQAKMKVQESGYIKRAEMQTVSEPPVQVAEEAFGLTAGQTMAKEVITIGDRYFVYQIADRKQQADEISEELRNQAKQQLLGITRNKLLANWLEHLKKDSKIWINESLLQ